MSRICAFMVKIKHQQSLSNFTEPSLSQTFTTNQTTDLQRASTLE